jgi:F-type H+-transporting ATPase subunit a
MEEPGLHISLKAEELFGVLGWPITNTVVTSWVIIAILLLVAFVVGRGLKLMPGKFQNVVEMLFEYVYGYVKDTLGSEKLAQRYFPLIATIFIFILAANMLDFLPIFGTFTVQGHPSTEFGASEQVPLFHAVSADLNTTLALAIISFFVIELSGILTLGVLKYASKFVTVTSGAMGFIVGLLELIGNLARLISFSFRLFGAIFAGEVLLMVIGSFVPLFLPVPLMAFEMFIGLLQAGIFAILTLAFIKIAIAEPHGEYGSPNHNHQISNPKQI